MSTIYLPSYDAPEGYGTFDQDNRLPESHCPICLEGESDKDIKVCPKCQSILDNQ